jgi:hypothetical protein
VWPTKGSIAKGADGDLVIVDSDLEWTITAATIHSTHPVSPYLGWQGKGHAEVDDRPREYCGRRGKLMGSPLGQWLRGPQASCSVDLKSEESNVR